MSFLSKCKWYRTFVYGNGIDEVLAMFNPESETPDPNDGLSLAAFCEDWLSSNATYDYDSSGTVDFEDFAVFASNWTGTLYSPSVESETRWYYLHDALGSVMAIVGSKNIPSDREFYLYDVYGKSQGNSESPSGNPYGFASYRYDEEIDLYYLRARYYDPELGRFISLDPLGIVPNAEKQDYAFFNDSVLHAYKSYSYGPISKCSIRKLLLGYLEKRESNQYIDGMNLYEYVGSNPVVSVDPYGLIEIPIYGKYCGLGHSGPGDPIDSLDNCCSNHDDGYTSRDSNYKECLKKADAKRGKAKKCAIETCKTNRDQQTCDADKGLVGCLNSIGPDPTAWEPPAPNLHQGQTGYSNVLYWAKGRVKKCPPKPPKSDCCK
ncbi:MAG: RHS repeat-associated core domain-containing protein [Sedimentisphaerales bacterium]